MDTLILKTGANEMDILNPTPEQVDIEDMINNLAHMRRWIGACPVTVLQHQFCVGYLLESADCHRDVVVAGLTHDLHEYATGDIAAPLLDRLYVGGDRELICGNRETGVPLADVQARIQAAIDKRLRVTRDPGTAFAVDNADKAARNIERDVMRGDYSRVPDQVADMFAQSPADIIAAYTDRLKKYGVAI